MQVPEVDTYVWFTRNNVSVLDQVVPVDTTLPRPLSVQLMQSGQRTKNIVKVKFSPTMDEEGLIIMVQLTAQQVVLQVHSLTNGGYLPAEEVRLLFYKGLTRE